MVCLVLGGWFRGLFAVGRKSEVPLRPLEPVCEAANSDMMDPHSAEPRYAAWTRQISQLQAQLQRAEAAQRHAELQSIDKSRLLAAASHDLRQPIHALGLFLDFLGATNLTKQQRSVFAHAQAACTASRNLLNNLLEYSRIEAGVVECKPTAVSIQLLFNEMEAEFAPLAEAKGLVFRTRDSGLVAWADRSLLIQALRNLLSNAVKYTHEGGILLSCRQRHPHLVLEVWDTGIGIDPSYHQYIFKEFRQITAAQDGCVRDGRAQEPGLGLGLAIVDRLAQLMKVQLNLRSDPGRGSVFRLSIPRLRDPISESVPFTGPGICSLFGLRVMLIDDDSMSRVAVQQLLQSWGCSCQAFSTLTAAVSYARISPPDVLITDFRLGKGVTGTNAIDVFREQINNSQACVIITGDTAPDRLQEAHCSGATLLLKPLTAVQLNQALKEMHPTRNTLPAFPGHQVTTVAQSTASIAA